METMGSYLRHRPEGRSSGNLESRFTDSPTSPGQQHLQGPQWPQPGPYSWPCCCSAATPSALWAATCLTPTAWPTGGSWCSCNNWGGSPLPPACRIGMSSHSPRKRWVAASCTRLKPSLYSMRWPSTPSSSSALKAQPLCGTWASWTSSHCTASAAHWPAILSEAGAGAARGSPAQGGLQPGFEEILPQSHSLSAREGAQPLCLGGCQGRSHESLLFLNKLAGEIPEEGLTHTWFNTEMILTDQQDHTASCTATWRILISAVIEPWNESSCQMFSGILSNIMFYSIDTGSSQMPELIYLCI